MTAAMRPTTFASKPKHQEVLTKHPRAKRQKNDIYECHLEDLPATNLSSHEFSGTSSRHHAIRSIKLPVVILARANSNRNSAHSLHKRHPNQKITPSCIPGNFPSYPNYSSSFSRKALRVPPAETRLTVYCRLKMLDFGRHFRTCF